MKTLTNVSAAVLLAFGLVSTAHAAGPTPAKRKAAPAKRAAPAPAAPSSAPAAAPAPAADVPASKRHPPTVLRPLRPRPPRKAAALEPTVRPMAWPAAASVR